MPATYTITVHCRAAWWLRPALAMLKVWVRLTGHMPPDAVIDRIARRAVRVSLSSEWGGR